MTVSFVKNAVSNGGSAITQYKLFIDNGNGGIFTPVITPSLLATKAFISNLKIGSSYRLKYQAGNINGFGEFSNVANILIAVTPNPPAKPIFKSYDKASSPNTLTLTLPRCIESNGGAPITAYELQRDSGDDFNSKFIAIAGYTSNS